MSDNLRHPDDGLLKAFDQLHADTEVIRAAYEALPREWLRRSLLVEYRCSNRSGCLLLHVWRGDSGRTNFYVPSYKMSRRRNAKDSVESARRTYTLDGDRIWRPRAGTLDDLAEWGNEIGIGLECDHLLPVTKTPAEILTDASTATRGRPFKRRVAGRYRRLPVE